MRVLYTWLRGGNLRPNISNMAAQPDPILSLNSELRGGRTACRSIQKIAWNLKHLPFVLCAKNHSGATALNPEVMRKVAAKTWDVCKTKCTWSNGGISNPLIHFFAQEAGLHTLCIASAYLHQKWSRNPSWSPGKQDFQTYFFQSFAHSLKNMHVC